MAGLPESDTDYKPWASLGAVYQGENAANANAMAVQQLLQQAFNNQVAPEKHAADMDYKNALAEQYRAQAERYSREDSDKYADKIAKADEAKRLQKLTSSIPMLERYASTLSDDTAPNLFPQFQNELANLPPELQQFFGTKDNLSLSTDLLKKASDFARGMHPELSKVERTNLTQQGMTSRNDATIASRERIAQLNNNIKATIAQANRAGKPLSKSQVEGMLLQKVSSGEITPEEMRALDIAQALAYNKGAAPNVAATIDDTGRIVFTPGQTKPSNVSGGRSAQGTTVNNIEATAKKAWGAYEPDKYEYRFNSEGKLQRRPKG